MYQLVIFDLDGTLLDTSEGVISSVIHTMVELNYTVPPKEILDTFIGPPIQDSFAKLYNVNDSEELQNIATVFRDYYKSYDLFKAKPYCGIYETLELLKNSGLYLAVATYKREDYALEILNHFDFDKYFNVMRGGDHENILKKHDIINLCVKETGVQRDSVLLVGDTMSDLQGAKNSGVEFLGVTYGFGFNKNSKIENVKFVDTAFDISRIVLGEKSDE